MWKWIYHYWHKIFPQVVENLGHLQEYEVDVSYDVKLLFISNLILETINYII